MAEAYDGPQFGFTTTIGEVNEIGRATVAVNVTTERGLIIHISVDDVAKEGVTGIIKALHESVPGVVANVDSAGQPGKES